jgi:hypothetical protein
MAKQGKHMSVFRFRLQQTNGSLPFSFSVCGKQTEAAVSSISFLRLLNSGDIEAWRHGSMETQWHGDTVACRHGHGDIKLKKENGSPADFSLIKLPFAYHANESLSFVCLLTKKQTEVIRLQTD